MKRLRPSLLLIPTIFSASILSAKADDRADLVAVFFGQVKSCYIIPIEARGTESILVEVRLKPDGSLERQPEIIRGSPDSLNGKAALRALNKCAPFHVPKQWASRYREWRIMRIQFNAD
jgi:colicin import membrane protein